MKSACVGVLSIIVTLYICCVLTVSNKLKIYTYSFPLPPSHFTSKTFINSERDTFDPTYRADTWIKQRTVATSAMYFISIQYLLRIHRVSCCPGTRYRLYEHKAIIVGTTAAAHRIYFQLEHAISIIYLPTTDRGRCVLSEAIQS